MCHGTLGRRRGAFSRLNGVDVRKESLGGLAFGRGRLGTGLMAVSHFLGTDWHLLRSLSGLLYMALAVFTHGCIY